MTAKREVLIMAWQPVFEWFEVWFRWDDGREEMRYRRPWPSGDASELKAEVDELHRRAREGGYESPYSYKVVPNSTGVPARADTSHPTPTRWCRMSGDEWEKMRDAYLAATRMANMAYNLAQHDPPDAATWDHWKKLMRENVNLWDAGKSLLWRQVQVASEGLK